ncbi:50S ribosomal protein L35, partial [Sphaeroforma arctica JP610]
GTKTSKAMSKRFKVMGNGNFKRKTSGKTHLNTKMTGEQTRHSRKTSYATDTQNRMLKKVLPNV